MSIKHLYYRPEGQRWSANPIVFVTAVAVLVLIFVSTVTIWPELLRPVDIFTAWAFAHLGSLFGFELISNKLMVIYGHTAIKVSYGCDGVLALMILLAGFLPFPCSGLDRLKGIVAGVLYVFFINQLRIAGLLYMATKGLSNAAFDFYHIGLGQAFAIFMVFAYWWWWATRIRRRAMAAESKDDETSDESSKPAIAD
jgi:exosortase/archaeosortase family protein